MKLIRRHPAFCALVAVVLLAIGAEAWFVFSLQRQEVVLERQLDQRITEIERLQRQRPGPTDENLRRARDDYAQTAEVLTTMLRSLRVAGPDELPYFQGEPQVLDAYFTITNFIGARRTAAGEAGVVIRADERFGFTEYANEGPEPELNRLVYRQLRTIEYLLGALFAARPRTFVGVQREDPRALLPAPAQGAGTTPAATPPRPPSAFSGGGSASGTASAASDFFTIDPQISARTPGYVDTMAFRLTFTGHTSALRGFMNALAAPEIPVVVRSVEVEPLRPDTPQGQAGSRGSTRGEEESAPRSDLAIVADNESRFVVTVELFELKIRAPDAPATAPKP